MAIVAAAIVLYVLRYFWRKQIWGGAAELERKMRTRLFNHFMIMDKTFYQRHRTGDLMAHATNDVTAIQNVAGDGVLTLVDSLIMGLSTMIAMIVFVDFRLTIVALLPLPFLAWGAWKLGDHLHVAFDKSQAAFSRLNNKTQESVSGIKVLKTFGQGKEDTAAFEKMVDEIVNDLKNKLQREVSSDKIGEAVLHKLKGIDHVAYIRFASVYRDFNDVDSFMKIISELSEEED